METHGLLFIVNLIAAITFCFNDHIKTSQTVLLRNLLLLNLLHIVILFGKAQLNF